MRIGFRFFILFFFILFSEVSFVNASALYNFYIPLSKKEDPRVQAFVEAFKADQKIPVAEIFYKDQSFEDYQAIYDLLSHSSSESQNSFALVTSDFLAFPDGEHYKGISILGAFPEEPYQFISSHNPSSKILQDNSVVGYINSASAALWAASINPHFQFKKFLTEEDGYTALKNKEIALLVLPIEASLTQTQTQYFKVISSSGTPFRNLYIVTSQKIKESSQKDIEKSLKDAFSKIENKSFLSKLLETEPAFLTGKPLEELINKQKPLMTETLRKILPDFYARGYTMDTPYSTYYISFQSPLQIAYALSLKDIEAPSLNKPFTYLDLGTGQGFTVNILAALYPESEFWGVDLNHEHIENAKAFAKKHNLKNAHFIEGGFAELDLSKLPKFDFITLHGVWSWVDAPIRHQAVEVVQFLLKPDGVFYISYNTLPGWSAFQPIATLIQTLSSSLPGNSIEQFKKALEEVIKLKEAGALFFEDTPQAASHLEEMRKMEDFSYLPHEYSNKKSAPSYFKEVATSLKKIGLKFGASLRIADTFPELFLSSQKIQELDLYKDDILRETVEDFLWNTIFRWDVFIRTDILPIENPTLREAIYYGTIENITYENPVNIGDYSFDFDKGIYKDILSSLKGNVKNLQELYQSPALQGKEKEQIFSALQVLLEANRISIFQKKIPDSFLSTIHTKNKDSLRFKIPLPFNQMVIEEASKQGKEFSVISPTLGGAYELDSTSGIFLNALEKTTSGKEGEWIYEFYNINNLSLPEGCPSSPEAASLFLKKKFDDFLKREPRNLLLLGIIEPLPQE